MDDNVQDKIDELRKVNQSVDYNLIVAKLRASYKIFNFFVSQLSVSPDIFNSNAKGLLDEVVSMYEYWHSIIIINKPIPAVVLKEFEKARSEALAALDFYVKFKELLFLK